MIRDDIEKNTVEELNELIKDNEKQFGTPSTSTQTPGQNATGAAGYSVGLHKVDPSKKIPVVKALRALNGMSMGEATQTVDNAPVVFAQGLTEEQAQNYKLKLEGAGASVSIRPPG
ncbi:hypothetical protein B8W70_18360 [Pseudomonas sp. 1239]|uniref:ribosomal protein bL12 n=1 Tax=unclassified Pseudomonas TaxID=196821 RepID=UPI000B4EC170|nr:ribosomal protein L7/L12 [Pseudomonas sp. 1239]OUM26768.1 hypothetical protein B8W70_18360 [Pseudomonas sp. 1239]